jgi:hypothetical protein
MDEEAKHPCSNTAIETVDHDLGVGISVLPNLQDQIVESANLRISCLPNQKVGCIWRDFGHCRSLKKDSYPHRDGSSGILLR